MSSSNATDGSTISLGLPGGGAADVDQRPIEPLDDNTVPLPSIFGWCLGIGACIILFAPLIWLDQAYPDPEEVTTTLLPETVGVAVILRATLRRLFRSGSRSLLQTTVGTVMRASARTMTRRVVRVSVKSLAMFLGRSAVSDESLDGDEAPLQQPAWLALLLGFVVLMASMAGVLYMVDIEQEAGQATIREGVLGSMSMLTGVVLGALPLLIYGGLLLMAAPLVGATVKLRTTWEAVLLQAYFTGSGSYLPLATDSEIEGPSWARVRLAYVSLGGLLALHLLCTFAGRQSGSDALEYLGAMFLIYSFVFSFPIAPLDGYYIWAQSKLLWVLTWAPLLGCFIWNLPERLHAIL